MSHDFRRHDDVEAGGRNRSAKINNARHMPLKSARGGNRIDCVIYERRLLTYDYIATIKIFHFGRALRIASHRNRQRQFLVNDIAFYSVLPRTRVVPAAFIHAGRRSACAA